MQLAVNAITEIAAADLDGCGCPSSCGLWISDCGLLRKYGTLCLLTAYCSLFTGDLLLAIDHLPRTVAGQAGLKHSSIADAAGAVAIRAFIAGLRLVRRDCL